MKKGIFTLKPIDLGKMKTQGDLSLLELYLEKIEKEYDIEMELGDYSGRVSSYVEMSRDSIKDALTLHPSNPVRVYYRTGYFNPMVINKDVIRSRPDRFKMLDQLKDEYFSAKGKAEKEIRNYFFRNKEKIVLVSKLNDIGNKKKTYFMELKSASYNFDDSSLMHTRLYINLISLANGRSKTDLVYIVNSFAPNGADMYSFSQEPPSWEGLGVKMKPEHVYLHLDELKKLGNAKYTTDTINNFIEKGNMLTPSVQYDGQGNYQTTV